MSLETESLRYHLRSEIAELRERVRGIEDEICELREKLSRLAPTPARVAGEVREGDE